MELQVDVWLRGTDFANTQTISGVGTDPAAWTDHDVSKLLKAMLLSIHRAKHPNSTDTPVFLRGFSWIVNPFEERESLWRSRFRPARRWPVRFRSTRNCSKT